MTQSLPWLQWINWEILAWLEWPQWERKYWKELSIRTVLSQSNVWMCLSTFTETVPCRLGPFGDIVISSLLIWGTGPNSKFTYEVNAWDELSSSFPDDSRPSLLQTMLNSSKDSFLEAAFWGSVSSVAQSCLTLCSPMDCSTSGFPVHHQLLEPTQTHVHWVRDAILPAHPLSSPSLPALNLCQHQCLFGGYVSLK